MQKLRAYHIVILFILLTFEVLSQSLLVNPSDLAKPGGTAYGAYIIYGHSILADSAYKLSIGISYDLSLGSKKNEMNDLNIALLYRERLNYVQGRIKGGLFFLLENTIECSTKSKRDIDLVVDKVFESIDLDRKACKSGLDSLQYINALLKFDSLVHMQVINLKHLVGTSDLSLFPKEVVEAKLGEAKVHMLSMLITVDSLYKVSCMASYNPNCDPRSYLELIAPTKNPAVLETYVRPAKPIYAWKMSIGYESWYNIAITSAFVNGGLTIGQGTAALFMSKRISEDFNGTFGVRLGFPASVTNRLTYVGQVSPDVADTVKGVPITASTIMPITYQIIGGVSWKVADWVSFVFDGNYAIFPMNGITYTSLNDVKKYSKFVNAMPISSVFNTLSISAGFSFKINN